MELDDEELKGTKRNRKKKCICCEEIEFWKQMNKDKEKFEDKYYAQICVCTYCKDTSIMKKPKGKITTKPYSLNYCPKCGRKLV